MRSIKKEQSMWAIIPIAHYSNDDYSFSGRYIEKVLIVLPPAFIKKIKLAQELVNKHKLCTVSLSGSFSVDTSILERVWYNNREGDEGHIDLHEDEEVSESYFFYPDICSIVVSRGMDLIIRLQQEERWGDEAESDFFTLEDFKPVEEWPTNIF